VLAFLKHLAEINVPQRDRLLRMAAEVRGGDK